MKVPLSWLRDYVDITLSPEELAELLTVSGLEVEQMDYIGIPRPAGLRTGRAGLGEGERPELAWDPTKFFVAEILEVKPHPNADRLTLATVDYGHGSPIQVVTGAPNIKVGDRGIKVAFGLEGARLFDGHKPGWNLMTLKKSKIRGIESGCMVLSEKELGMSEDHEGIILLPPDAPVGKPLADYLGDVIYDVKINPNMARAASVIGVVREIAALTNQPVREPSQQVVAEGAPIQGQASVVIREPALNPRFTAALVHNIQIKPSPFWMQRRLKLAGMRPINNMVDVTNYVMLEIGQPLHAFDYDKLVARAGGPPTISTRLAEPGEHLETLDGVKRTLDPFTILVCDTRGSLSIGGIMGGAESEIDENTKSILLEAAAWDYINIRRTMAAQHISSEAGYRFSRGVHPSQAIVGLKRAIELMRELGGDAASGKTPVIARGFIDEYPGRSNPVMIDLPATEVKRLLGVELGSGEIADLLKRLDFRVEYSEPRDHAPVFRVSVPDYRMDVDGTDDLIEEIARLYGYARIPLSRMKDELPPQQSNVDLDQEEQVKNVLVDAGLQEVISYSLTTPERETLFTSAMASPREYVRIENPISAERTVMRQTLLANLLELAAANLRYRPRAAFFELGPVYWKRSPEDRLLPREVATALPQDEELPLERRRLAVLLTGSRQELSWDKTDQTPMGFFDLKGVLEALLGELHIAGATYVPAEHPAFHPGRAAMLKLDSEPIGVFGEMHPLARERFDLSSQPVLMGEFDLDALLAHVPERHAVQPLSRYPAVVQDLAVVVDEAVPAEQVTSLICQTGGQLLQRAALFDIYRGEQIPAGKKSLAFALTFQAMDRTLSDADATKLRDKIVQRLGREVGGELRGN